MIQSTCSSQIPYLHTSLLRLCTFITQIGSRVPSRRSIATTHLHLLHNVRIVPANQYRIHVRRDLSTSTTQFGRIPGKSICVNGVRFYSYNLVTVPSSSKRFSKLLYCQHFRYHSSELNVTVRNISICSQGSNNPYQLLITVS